jgi:hypothetical protein
MQLEVKSKTKPKITEIEPYWPKPQPFKKFHTETKQKDIIENDDAKTFWSRFRKNPIPFHDPFFNFLKEFTLVFASAPNRERAIQDTLVILKANGVWDDCGEEQKKEITNWLNWYWMETSKNKKQIQNPIVLSKSGKDERLDIRYDPYELKLGIKVELEHTDDEEIAKKIAKDHLDEIKNYYTLLMKMEKEHKKIEKSTTTPVVFHDETWLETKVYVILLMNPDGIALKELSELLGQPQHYIDEVLKKGLHRNHIDKAPNRLGVYVYFLTKNGVSIAEGFKMAPNPSEAYNTPMQYVQKSMILKLITDGGIYNAEKLAPIMQVHVGNVRDYLRQLYIAGYVDRVGDKPPSYRINAKGLSLVASFKENPVKKPSALIIQSVVFPKEGFTASKARAWLKAHGLKSSDMDLKTHSRRFRQHSPGRFHSYMAKKLPNDVVLVLGTLKRTYKGKYSAVNRHTLKSSKPEIYHIEYF